jgi:TRAP transporter 4TM/12TM fusion protein
MTGSRTWHTVVRFLSVFTCLYFVWFVIDPGGRLGIRQLFLMTQPFLGGALAMTVALTFVIFRATGARDIGRPPWYDILLILSCLISGGYYLFFYKQIDDRMLWGVVSVTEVVLTVVLVIVLFEAGRRVIGWPMSFLTLLFVLHVFLGRYFHGFLHSGAWTLEGAAHILYQSNDGIFGIPLRAVATMAVMFIIFGEFLRVTGGGDFLIELASSLMGRFRGGPAKVAVVASAFFGTLSGSITANIAATGSVTIPLMKRIGYRSEFAGATEAVSSTGGQVMPPVMGAVAFIMAEMINMPYNKLILMAAFPAILYFFSEFIFIDYEAAKVGLKGLPSKEVPSLRTTLIKGYLYLIPLAGLLIFLLVFNYSPALSALYATLLLLLVTSFRKETRITLRKVVDACEEAGRSFAIVFPAVGLAGIILGSIGLTGLALGFSMSILDWAGENMLALLLLAGMACFILGMGTSAVAIYVIVSILIAPPLVKAGVPLLAAHMFVFYWALVSFLTPPVAVGAYIAAGIAKGNPMKTAITSTRIGMAVMLVPFVFIYRPGLLLIGSVGEIAVAILFSFTGIWGLVSGLSGYAIRETNWVQRLLFLAGGVIVIMPWGTVINLIGSCALALALLWQVVKVRWVPPTQMSTH